MSTPIRPTMARSPDRSFSACGDAALEQRIARDLARCVAALRERLPRSWLRGVVLGGGYGRGEGGVRYTPAPVPFNDYDLFVVTPPLPRALAASLRLRLGRMAAELSEALDVEVELAVLDTRTLERPPRTLAMADLRWRHRVLLGAPDLLGRMPGPMLNEIPPVEATRLLTNRTALLLMAAGMAPGEQPLRYVAKAWLASGDARLLVSGRYHPSWGRRLEALAREPEGPYALGPTLSARYEAIARMRLEGRPAPLEDSLPKALAEAAASLRESLRIVERVRLGVDLEQDARYRRAVVDCEPAGWRDRVRDLRDLARGEGPETLLTEGARSARLHAELPALLGHLAAGRPVDARGHTFLRRWRSLP